MSDCQDIKNGCDLHQFQRNNYFYGKLMTVRDFGDEQSYMNEKRQLLNRILSGFGIVCGFEGLSVSAPDGGNVSILLPTGGVALDCCGREIVVPDGSLKKIVNEKTGSTLTRTEVTGLRYLYLKFKPCYGEMVHSASNPSSCDETCCPNRIVEDFDVIASESAPLTTAVVCPDLSGAADSGAAKAAIKAWIGEEIKKCPDCDDARVFLAAVNSDLTVNADTTREYGIFVKNSKSIFDILTCHVTDFSNPHKTTAQQVGALASIDGVHNDGGNVDLVQANSITISPNDTAKTITIGESHSGTHGNPHQTKHGELDDVLPVDPEAPLIIRDKRDKHVSNADARRWNSSVIKINDTAPDGDGKINIAAGNNISIAQAANTITISSSGGGGGECLAGSFLFKEVAPKTTVNSSPVKMPNIIFGIILGLEYTVMVPPPISHPGPAIKKTFIVTGSEIRNIGIELSSSLDLDENALVVALTNIGDKVFPEIRVRWWAIAPSKILDEISIGGGPRISRNDLIREIAMNPDTTVKSIMTKYSLNPSEKNDLLAPLIESGQIKLSGTGSNSKVIINA